MLTGPQLRCLYAIQDIEAETGMPVTYRNLGERLGYTSISRGSSCIFRMVSCLEERGYVQRVPPWAQRRRITVLRRAPVRYFIWDDESKALVPMNQATESATAPGPKTRGR